MGQESTLTIQFPVRMPDASKGFAYVNHTNLDASVYAGSLNAAKSKLRPMVQSEIDSALLQVANFRQYFIGCVDGTVLLVQFRNGHWGYEIAGPDRKHTSGVHGGESFEVVCNDARHHAQSSYNGIAWEVGQ